MPSDIRSFFGGTSSKPASQDKPTSKTEALKKGRGSRKVLDDSDEEETKPSPKKATPKKQPPKKRAASPEGEATNASEYFGSRKPKRSSTAKSNPGITKEFHKVSPAKYATTQSPAARSPNRRKKAVDYDEDGDLSGVTRLNDDDDDDDEKDDIFTADYKNTRQNGDDYQASSDEGEETAKENSKGKPAKSGKANASTGRKRKSDVIEEGDETPKKKQRAPRKSPAKKKSDEPENTEIQAIFDSIPTVRPPTPPGGDGEEKKFDFRGQQKNVAPPPGAGSKELPQGEENCLAGLSFVFTGLLDTLPREEGQNLVKQYGGKIVGAPSTKTSYVVLGRDAGPKKLDTIRKNNIKTIDEDGLFELIKRLPPNGGDGKAAAKNQEKKEAEMEKVRQEAEAAEKAERQARDAAVKKAEISGESAPVGGRHANDKAPVNGKDVRLWTVKHAPTQLAQICGNKGQVEKLQRWLKAFPKNQRTKFKLGGADGSGTHRAVMIHGPPGIGKTTAAHLVAKLEGFDIVESNASDTRSKRLVEAGLKGVLSTTSLFGYFAGDGEKVDASKKKLVLIMDEVDGMSAGDRGGVGALAAVCKKTQVPMILICNDRKQQKMKPFDYVTYDLPFRRPTVDQIRSRMMTIGYREGIKLPANIMDALIEGTSKDIRQVVNMLSTAKLDQTQSGPSGMTYDESKQMSKSWEKHIVLKPWDLVGKILSGQLFQPGSKTNLNQKAELYFNDHEFAPLMLQENYLNTSPIAINPLKGRERNLKHLELAEQAASAISDGDLVDRMIHGAEQHWALMPTHAIFSFVRPASFVAGTPTESYRFTSWLGKNSNQGKLSRFVKEIGAHMRLRANGDRSEIRQQYMPLLWSYLVKRLEVEGKEAVPSIIELMDSYYLTKEDWDALLELGVGPMDQDKVKVETQAKATFTRLYNQQPSHPLPFMKASSIVAPKKQSKEKPDLEEALEESDEGEVVDEQEGGKDEAGRDVDEEDADLSKDKYVKQPKKKKGAAGGAGGGAAAAKGKGKAAAGGGKGKGRARGKDKDVDDDALD